MKENLNVNESYKNVLQNAILVNVTVNQWGNSKKISEEKLKKITGKTLSKRVKSSKELINREMLGELNSKINKVKLIFQANALPFPIRGIYLIPINLLEKTCEEADEAIEEMKDARKSFTKEYRQYIKDSKEELGEELFDPNDYPEQIENRFDVSYQLIKLDVPGELQGINPALYKAEMQKFKDTMTNTRNECILFLREAFLKEVKEVVNSLTATNEKGEKKAIRKETMDKMEKFFQFFQERDLFKDQDFFKLIKETKVLMAGIDSKDIKESDALKGYLVDEMKKVAKVAEQGITKFKRSITL